MGKKGALILVLVAIVVSLLFIATSLNYSQGSFMNFRLFRRDDFQKIQEDIALSRYRWTAARTNVYERYKDNVQDLAVKIDVDAFHPVGKMYSRELFSEAPKDFFKKPDFAEHVFKTDYWVPLDTPLPKKFSWKKYVTGIRDQGNCGSCWAHAIVAAVEAKYRIQNNITSGSDTNLSELDLMACLEKPGGIPWGCNGVDFSKSYEAYDFLQNFGVTTETKNPYKINKVPPKVSLKSCQGPPFIAPRYRISDWSSVIQWSGYVKDYFDTSSSDIVLKIKNALLHGPVPASMLLSKDFLAYKSGIYESDCNANPLDAHIVLIVGWDDDMGAWIAKNSFGADWGEDGFFNIKYGTCHIGLDVKSIGKVVANDKK